jgi:hypothetical protein
MSRHPGFSYDAARKRARFDCYVPGTAGAKRRRKTVSAATRAEALALWRAFLDELAAETAGASRTPAVAANVPLADDVGSALTLREFVDRHFETIAAGLRPSTQRSHRSIIAQRLMPTFGDVKLDSITTIRADAKEGQGRRE